MEIEQIPVVIVENKVDLEEERNVNNSEGIEFARRNGAGFIETSAKTRKNIDELFVSLYHRACRGKFEVVEFVDAGNIKEWKEENFKHMPEEFRKRVRTFVLVTKRLEDKKKEKNLPKPIVKIILKLLFEEERRLSSRKQSESSLILHFALFLPFFKKTLWQNKEDKRTDYKHYEKIMRNREMITENKGNILTAMKPNSKKGLVIHFFFNLQLHAQR